MTPLSDKIYFTVISKALILLSLCALQASCQITNIGPCPTDLTIEQDFDLTAVSTLI